MSDFIILKLGGSLITLKGRSMTACAEGINSAAKGISRAGLSNNRLFIVHGGGSFGHHWAKKFRLGMDLSAKPSAEGISRTRNAMFKLNSLVSEGLCNQRIFCDSITPSELFTLSNKELSPKGRRRIEASLNAGLVPLSFGDVLLSGRGGARIMSGDRIVELLARHLRAIRVVFAMDVDGIYASDNLQGKPLNKIKTGREFQGKIREIDVTGGIIAKVSTGIRIARGGADVFYVNGFKPSRLSSALSGLVTERATVITHDDS